LFLVRTPFKTFLKKKVWERLGYIWDIILLLCMLVGWNVCTLFWSVQWSYLFLCLRCTTRLKLSSLYATDWNAWIGLIFLAGPYIWSYDVNFICLKVVFWSWREGDVIMLKIKITRVFYSFWLGRMFFIQPVLPKYR
jgi:hypothetical protein